MGGTYMKITFLVPPTYSQKVPDRLFGCSFALYYLQPLSYLYPAAIAERAGAEVIYLDCPVEGMDEAGFEKFLEKDNSDAYVMFTLLISKKMDLEAAEVIRRIRGDEPFIGFMGPQPTYEPEAFINNPNDIVIRGETELTVEEFARDGEVEYIKGISYQKNGKITHNPVRSTNSDLDGLPFPAQHLIKRDEYFNPKLRRQPSAVVLASRGCGNRCYYCVPCAPNYAREIEGRKDSGKKPVVRVRSAENVIEELEKLAADGYRSISFMDDQFIWEKERTLAILDALKRLELEFGILARADRLLDPEIVEALKDSGCSYVDIGIESLNQEILDYIQKDLKIEDFYKAIELLKRYGVEPKLNILLGSCPLETRETIKGTVKEIKKLGVEYVMFSLCSPFPGTQFYDFCKENEYIIRELDDMDALRNSLVSYPHLEGKEMDKLIKWAYRYFYLDPRYLTKRVLKMRSFADLKNNIKSAVNLFS
jgi:radical SAM superfamily enzyme YgiQ (UPF0313 family)